MNHGNNAMDKRVYKLVSISLICITAVAITSLIGCSSGYNRGMYTAICASKRPEPLSVDIVIRKFRANGYQVEKTPDQCAARDTVMVLTVTPKNDIRADAFCYVDLRPLYGRGYRYVTNHTWVNSNVTCAIIPSSKDKASADYEQLKRAVKALTAH
jgi:hypothetical protein